MNDGPLLTVEFALCAMVVLMFCCAVWLLLRRWSPRAVALQPYYHRLCEIAPASPCPCRRGRKANRAYADCCRPRDVERLTSYATDYAWRKWSHRSYGGRRRSRSMGDRMAEYPLRPVELPDWVIAPNDFAFPIAQADVQAWNPLGRQGRVDQDDETTGGMPDGGGQFDPPSPI